MTTRRRTRSTGSRCASQSSLSFEELHRGVTVGEFEQHVGVAGEAAAEVDERAPAGEVMAAELGADLVEEEVSA